MRNLSGDELRREIDDTLAELEGLEAEVLSLYAQLLGPQTAAKVALHIEAAEQAPRVAPLRKGKS